ncbi:MAG TPA: Na+/H+ antiporter NhaA [Gammaproteobacteria bacterium]
MLDTIKDFIKLESASGITLIGAAIVAMILANSPLSMYYALLIEMPVEIRTGPLQIAKPLLLWVNDGLMAIFFFLVGLELKREFLEGELSDRQKVIFPAIGALGGMLVPALIYLFINRHNPIAVQGWAIPAATDIAFALGVLSLLSTRVPTALKVFLISLAIFDDVGAIIIIAVFYSDNLSLAALLIATSSLVILYVLNRRNITETAPYVLIGTIMWIAVLKSGVHATLAGVLLALFIPMRDMNDPAKSPLMDLEHNLHTAVAFVILPLFAFVNAGIPLLDVGMNYLLHPVPLGIAAGLFFGKQLGVFGFCWLAVRLRITKLPEGINWGNLYGVSLLCGVGFTMSLFIGTLAFENTGQNLLFDERLGIIIGSLLSACAGFVVLHKVLPSSPKKPRLS